MNEKSFPVFKIQNETLSIAAFEGQYGRYYVLQRSVYNPKTKEWKNESIFITKKDFLNLGYVGQKMLDWALINPEQKKERQQEQPQQEQTSDDDIPF